MARTYQIFATREDLLTLLNSAEASRPIQYVRAGLFDSSTPVVTYTACDIEDLGIASHGDQNLEPTFLVLDLGTPINVRPVPQRRGGTKYAIDQLENPQSIAIAAGGEYGDKALISGQIGTTSRDKKSLSLMRLFGKLVLREMKNIKNYYLGKEAAHALASGVRLTASINSPKKLDLQINESA